MVEILQPIIDHRVVAPDHAQITLKMLYIHFPHVRCDTSSGFRTHQDQIARL